VCRTFQLSVSCFLIEPNLLYSFNETYTTLIPALMMGNTVVMKLPRVGIACHFPTFELFRDCFPPGVVNIISGSGRETMPPIMRSGLLDGFAFIGTSTAADDLLKTHPKPHRLRVTLGLEASFTSISSCTSSINGINLDVDSNLG
jgi:glyceraldehyde-3-phosphate dehydrogenase (NADP+)